MAATDRIAKPWGGMSVMPPDLSTASTARSIPLARSRPHALGLLVAAWAALCGSVVGVGWLLTNPLAGSVGEGDDDLALWLAGNRTPLLNDIADAGSLLGDTLTGQIALVVVALVFSAWQRSVVPALFVGLLEAGLLGIYLVASHLIPRSRPPVRILDPGLVPDHSFPSGHVATATAIYGSIVVLTWTYSRAARRWTTPLLVLPLCVMLARIYQGAHHLSDVVTSIVYATTWLALVTTLVLRGGRFSRRAAPRSRPGGSRQGR